MNNTSVWSLSLATFVAVCVFASSSYAIPAFPGAEGHGAVATGGRGGAVYEVTNLDDSGTGSLRWALNHSGARTIVFRVSGTIHLTSDLSLYYGDVTIAGQTAPGDGICIANGTLYAGYNNVIIRYIHCRLGDQWPNGTDNNDTDATWARYGDRIIVDHVTASWSIDETFSYYVNTNVTVQWCMMTESLYNSHHAKGAHGYGGIWGSTNSSWHHNLLAHHSSRNPRIDGEVTNNVDLRNNVIYNWGGNSCYGGEKATVNIVNCYYKYGPATGSSVKDRIAQPSLTKDAAGVPLVPHQYGQWYITGNYVDGYPAVTADNWAGGVDPDGGSGELSLCKSLTPFPVATTYPVTVQTALVAYNYVLNSAGCSLVRDSVDIRIINEVTNRTATYGGSYGVNKGIIDSQTTVGGWPTLNSTTAPTDTDHDGMPDTWETARGLNPNNAADRNGDRNGDGYTNLEEYINSLCPDPYGADLIAPTPDPTTWATAPYAVGNDTITMVATTATDASGVEYRFACTVGAGHSSAWQDGTSYTDTSLAPGTYAYTVTARDKSAAHNAAGTSSAGYVTLNVPPDVTAPTPNPMTWSVAPHGDSLHSISMTATTATDTSGVEYYFTCTTGAGHSSAWQDSTTYVDTGLAEGATCSYNVRARDKSPAQNTTSPSTPDASASTLLDTAAPTPNPMTFAVAPAADGLDTITMTASLATDISDVEYFFQNSTAPSHFSGWQDGTGWTDTGLASNTTYAYVVAARDKSLARNQTAWSDPNSATTLRFLCTGPIASDLGADCQVDFIDYAMLANQWSQELPLTVDTLTNGTFETDVLPWQTFTLPGATGYFVAYFDETTGNPIGSAVIGSDTDPDGTTGYWFYQTMPVIAGKQYKLLGEWMGDLSGSVATDPCNLGNWAEVKVAFESNTDPNTWTSLSNPATVMYRKAFGSVTQNIGPSGAWGWEQITASLTNGPADGIFTATEGYMVVAFSEGGLPLSGVGYYYLDNLAVRTSPCPSADFSGDCILDMKDIAAFAEQWLTCNRNPADECWK